MINKKRNYPVPFAFYFWDRFFGKYDLEPEEYIVSNFDRKEIGRSRVIKKTIMI